MKKSATRRAIDAILASRAKFPSDKGKWLTIGKAAKKFKLNKSGIARALKRHLTIPRCGECGKPL